jgi:UDP-3-O-[3-hydroxymyristoyl] glucosamine N-acyltransferase
VGALVAPPDVDVGGRPALRSPSPSLDFARAVSWIVPPSRPAPGVHPSAVVDAAATIDPSAAVGPHVVVGARARVGARTILHANATVCEGVVLGADCVLHPGVVVGESCEIGDRVVLQPGVVIGGDGFGYEFNERGEHEKVPQVGNVVIEDDVEIGANATVDRARLGSTRIGRGAKIDNLVQIGHNCVIGAHSVVVAQSGLAGSTILGERVIVMAQAGLANHVTVGAGSFLGARAGVIESLPPGSRVWGFPAQPERAWHRSSAWLARLPELARRLRRVERRLGVRDGRGEVDADGEGR